MFDKTLIDYPGDQPLKGVAAAKPNRMQCLAQAGDFVAGDLHV
jgi:hypothetical protein